ncbi:MAG TPA: 4-alpha-glucanotransferase [Acidimicrobiales bacterium]|nr:4-alpha-glucanotransferase [Acidimicrobiales bacterium]
MAPLGTDAARWGIQPGYSDFRDVWREAPESTVRALLEAMGAGASPPPRPADARHPDGTVMVVTEGEELPLPGRWGLATEDGGDAAVDGSLPPDVPLGYHRLRRDDDGHAVSLIVTPPACHLADDLRTWGWAVQLYSARSGASWGIGDLGDLRRLGGWSAGQGAGMVLVNPLHAAQPAGAQQASPYSPSSRCFRNPLYLRVEDVPGASAAGGDLEALAAAGRALNDRRLIDRDEVWRLKAAALERLWSGFAGDAAFRRWCDEQGAPLKGWARFCAIADVHGLPWTSWPAELRRADGPAVALFARRHADRVRYHQWLQWLLDVQLGRAGEEVGVVQDLAIGADAGGADAWLWQDCFALDVRVGAPPDEFAVKGQDWGLPPLDPWRLRDAAYEPFVATLRAAFRHAGGVRIDHVMGLFRLFWVPESAASPAEGTYVTYPWHDLLGILALESARAGAWVVGEDLGTVEPFVREELARRRVLSYRLVWFEPDPPAKYPQRALAAVTTHDLPTVAGLWTGSDLEEQQRLGTDPNVESTLAIRDRLRHWTGAADDEAVGEVVLRTHRLLGEAPSMVVAATLDDALGVEERPNLPGTTTERPNWSIALPLPLEDVESDPGVAAVAEAIGRRPPPPP